jgi:hypothetical protein
MKRTEKISTSVTEEEKGRFRVLAAQRDMSMAELLREIVYDEIEGEGYETTRSSEGNAPPAATTAE